MKTESGQLGEKFACSYLEKLGYTVIHKNYHSRYGEIDIIACDDKYIAFIEVKTRNALSKAAPRAWVTQAKQNKIIKTALLYLQSHPNSLQPRFDVMEIVIDNDIDHFKVIEVNHLKNAFWMKWGYSPY